MKYEVEVRTGKSKGSATDARVYLELHGAGKHEGRSSGELRLLPDDGGTRLLPPFQRGATDTFQVACPDVGLPTRLRVWHDNTGRHPDWRLEHVKIRRKARRPPPAAAAAFGRLRAAFWGGRAFALVLALLLLLAGRCLACCCGRCVLTRAQTPFNPP